MRNRTSDPFAAILRRPPAIFGAALTLLSCLPAHPTNAAPYNYTGGGSGTAAAPISGKFSNGFGVTLTTGGTVYNSLSFGGGMTYTATDDISQLNINSLSFTNSSAVTLIPVNTSNYLKIGGTNPAINLNNTGSVALGINLSLAANTTFTGNGSATVSGIVSGISGLTIGTSGTLFGGVLTLTGANTYQGGTVINGGTVALGTDGGGNENGNSLGTGAVTVNSGQLRLGGDNTANAFTIGNAITLNGGTIFSASGSQHLSGGITVNGGTLMQQYAGQDLSIDGTISGAGSLVVDSMAVAGGSGGVHFTQQNNQYTGILSINGASAASGTAGGCVFVDNFNGLQSAIVNTSSTMRGLILNAGTGTYTFGALAGDGNLSIGGSTLNVGGAGIDTSYSGSLSGTGGVVKTGVGTMTITGANTYSGGTTINQGTLNVSSDSSLGASGTVINFTGGVLQTGTSGITSSRAITLDSSGGTIDTNGNNSAFSGTVSDASGATGKLTKTGSGTLTLSGSNNYSGGTTVSGGMLSGSAGSFGSGAVTVGSGAMVDYTQSSGTTGTAGNTLSGQGNVTFGGNTSISNGGTVNYTGTDSENTTVDSGTLMLRNPTTAALTGPVTVATGATLELASGSGNGTSTGSGNSPYEMSTKSNLTLDGGTFKTNGFSEGSVGTNGKPNIGMGSLTLAGSTTSIIDFTGGASILAFNASGGNSWSGTLNVINYVGGTNQLYIGNTANLTKTQLGDILINGFSVIQTSSGQILSSSPEPSSLVSSLLGAGALGGLICLRRRAA